MTATHTTQAWVGDDNVALFTDLYELTMLQAYVEEQMEGEAVFSLYVRRLPHSRNYLLTCGLDAVLHYLETLRFSPQHIDYLSSLQRFSERFLRWLAGFHFTGHVYAVPEGTPMFANEPLLEVVAPLPQAQLVETFIMNQITLGTVLASKAVRVVAAAHGRAVVDFGARRTHGADAAVKAARAFYIAGVTATSNVLAGQLYGLPLAGTMAHSFVQSYRDEMEAFRAFIRHFPQTVLLVDTYDTLTGVEKVIALARELGDDFKVQAVRLDSGDLAGLARKTRALLDTAGLSNVGIFASGSLNEHTVAELIANGAPINGFGIGTAMGVSQDAPDLDIVYKLCAYAGEGRLKLSTDKPVLPGRKQVFRIAENGQTVGDVIARAEDDPQAGRPLLRAVMRNGHRVPEEQHNLTHIREYTREQIERLPAGICALTPADPSYPVAVSAALRTYQEQIAREVAKK